MFLRQKVTNAVNYFPRCLTRSVFRRNISTNPISEEINELHAIAYPKGEFPPFKTIQGMC